MQPDPSSPNRVTPSRYSTLRTAGVSRRRLAGTTWRRSARGFYVPAGTDGTEQRIADAAALIPANGALGGWAAAYLLGAKELDGRDPVTGRRLPVLACVGHTVHRPSLPWLRYTRAELPATDVVVRSRYRITAPTRTAIDLARWAPSLPEALVGLDALAARGLLDGAELTRRLEGDRRTGARQARAALSLARAGVRSGWESRLRYRYVVELALPEPLLNPPLFSSSGILLGYPDLFDPDAALVTEFDGGGHRERRQHHDDNVREELFEAHGLVVARADSIDVRGPLAPLAARLRSAHRRGLRRDRSRDRWTLSPPPDWMGLL